MGSYVAKGEPWTGCSLEPMRFALMKFALGMIATASVLIREC